MGSIALKFLGVMSVLKKTEEMAEKVAEILAKNLHVVLPPQAVISVLNKAEKLAEKVAEKVAEKLATNQEESLMHVGHEPQRMNVGEPAASLQPQRLNHDGSSIACHHVWTSVSPQQPQAH